jgi:hypothetical protein
MFLHVEPSSTQSRPEGGAETMNCAVSGCTKAAKRYGRYCNTHGTRDRRHGHPRQETVRTKDLRPYRDIVRRRMQRNADAAAWQTLETIWRQTVRRCQPRLREYLGGKPAIRWQRQAWEEIIKLAQAEPREVIETTAAMVVMQSFDPWRFRSDRAFWFQLVRWVRALAEIMYCSRFSKLPLREWRGRDVRLR